MFSFFMNFIESVQAQTTLPGAASATAKGTEVLGSVFDSVSKIIVVVVIFLFCLLISRIIVGRVIEAIHKNNGEDEHKEVTVLASRLIYMGGALVGIAIGLSITNTFGELAWLFGAVGLGIGFAFQTIIGNFVAGLTLLIQRKIRIGDMVEIEDVRGIVTNIGSRSVILHDFHGHDYLIPNLDFFNKKVKIFTANPFRRIWVNIGIGYDSDFPAVHEKIFEILKRYPEVEKEPTPDILIDEIKDSTVGLQIRWWIKSSMRWWTLQSKILQDIFVELQEMGVDISFNITTLRVDSHQSDALFDFMDKKPLRSYSGKGIRNSMKKTQPGSNATA